MNTSNILEKCPEFQAPFILLCLIVPSSSGALVASVSSWSLCKKCWNNIQATEPSSQQHSILRPLVDMAAPKAMSDQRTHGISAWLE